MVDSFHPMVYCCIIGKTMGSNPNKGVSGEHGFMRRLLVYRKDVEWTADNVISDAILDFHYLN